MVPRLVTSLIRVMLGSIIPVDGIIGVGRSVPCNLSADARMVPSEATAYFPQRKIGNCHMTDDILLFSGKMMVGHDGLLSEFECWWYFTLPENPVMSCILSHVVHFEVEFTHFGRILGDVGDILTFCQLVDLYKQFLNYWG